MTKFYSMGRDRKRALLRKKCFVFTVAALLLFTALFAGACEKPKAEPADEPAEVVPEPPETYPWPYVGTETTDAAIVKNRPLSVKIENSSAARPQMGLNEADIIYETMVEGGETRFNCIFQSTIPDEVGPVRSARHSDLWIVPQYQGLFFYSGANAEVLGKLRKIDIGDMSHNAAGSLYHRVSFRSAPHNLYLELSKAYEKAAEIGIETSSENLTPLKFGVSDAVPTATASALTVSFASKSAARWDWNAERQVYLRTQGGGPHKDATTDEQIFSTNVVVIVAEYTKAQTLDPAGNPTYDTNLGGTGKAIVFKDGMQYDCQWTADKDTPPKFTDAAGKEITLNPGRTWIEVPTPAISITIE
ncbi:MAG: DUF3048 domain-containing protein [Clostridiales Family XIII bacterium]|jgi:hypothetical protein|nr:DUF3048 domain-containing protein [Clostridiales Family XIII bacterium]